MAASTFSFLDREDGWSSVDAWESPGIVSAAEASEADKTMVALREEIKRDEEKHRVLAAAAKKHMTDLTDLIEKVELSTATKEEMERLSKLEKKMMDIKKDLTATTSAIKSKTEELAKSKTKSKEYDLLKSVKESDIKSVIRLVRDAEAVDLAFLLDCTGSMSSYIEATKESIKNIVRRVSRTNQGLKLRIAVVGYRDISDSNRFEMLDFTTCTKTFEEFVGHLKANGGGDAPEDIAGAFQKANSLSWTQTSRVTFLIADAPCHGSEFHRFDDSYPHGTPGIDVESEIKKLMKKGGQAGMSLHFGRITVHCDQMIRVFKDHGIEFAVSDLKDAKNLAASVTTGVRKSISKSITASRSKSKSKSKLSEFGSVGSEGSVVSIKDYIICVAKPSPAEWERIDAKSVQVLKNKPVKSINDLKSPLYFGWIRFGISEESSKIDETRMLLRRAKDPFAEGESRLAFYGMVGSSIDRLRDVVVKSFKTVGSKASTDRKRYLIQMEVSTIAHFLVEKYNTEYRPSHCAEVSFLNVCVVEGDDEGKERYCMEEILPGAADSFNKFSNNTGYWNEDEINQSLLLFTRFTHEVTGGYLMVTDLQGVRQGNQYILTDPAILCQDSARFGKTNLGRKFIDKCMESTAAMLEEYGWDE